MPENILNHKKPLVIWMTGLPGSGKSTISRKVQERLLDKGIRSKILELDEIRKIITPNPKYTDEERDIVYFSLVYMAKLLADCGVNVIIDATGNRLAYREKARELIPSFIEVYIKCPLEICIKREEERKARHSPKDIYIKGIYGMSNNVPGINVPYEESSNPEIVIDSSKCSIDESTNIILKNIGF